ncbi:gastrula zinc finger protein XlCGF57.1-like [Ischnura elegans]|uniref:gastrula zinc finger protein XlCGF57.1-like n=1 Tax=Ischnura elegans TaxID=197161 RepID=UPI001ED86BC1|nr:gastrula zinc finger protein XlCGF57.1-like [Ischnura elegans]
MCPLCLKKLTEFNVFKNTCLESNAVLIKLLPRNYCTSIEGDGVADDKSGPSVETKDQTTEIYIPVQDCLLPWSNMQPTSGEDRDPIESSTFALHFESTTEAPGLPAPEEMPSQISSASYLHDECIGPKSLVAQIDSKTGASQVRIGRNVMDKDLENFGALDTDEISCCSIPDDRLCNTKEIESLKSSGGRATMTVAVDEASSVAPNTTDSLRCIRIYGNDRSGCDAVMGDNEEVLDCSNKNPGNKYRSSENSYHCSKCRDGLNKKNKLIDHTKTHFVARSFIAVAESANKDVFSSGNGSSCEPISSKTISGVVRKRLEPRQNKSGLPRKSSGGKSDRKNMRRVTRGVDVEEKSTSQSSSSKSSCNRNLHDHMGAREKERPFSCSVCAKCFTQKSYLTLHSLTHTGNKPYSCGSKSFTQRGNLDRHMRTEAGEKLYSCNECGRSFSTKGILVTHFRTHAKEKPYPCNGCEKSFSYKSHLVSHLRKHTGEKPFSCFECGRSFSTKGILGTHMHTHTGGKRHSCNECEKSFSYKSHLVSHLRKHTGEKPFSCFECGRSFSTKGILGTHMHTHTGGKHHSCNECEKSFSYKSHLVSHLRKHTGEKPFSCFECGKSFSTKGILVTHLRTHS